MSDTELDCHVRGTEASHAVSDQSPRGQRGYSLPRDGVDAVALKVRRVKSQDGQYLSEGFGIDHHDVITEIGKEMRDACIGAMSHAGTG